MKTRLFFTVLLCLSALPAQQQKPDAAQLAEMEKLSFLEGEWAGSGWVLAGPGQQRTEFSSRETVVSKLGGLVVQIEGLHKSKLPGREEPVTVHDALALVSYDSREKRYRFQTHEASGRSLDAQARLVNGGLQWGFQDPQSGYHIRFTIRISDGGQWSEIGESSPDGASWYKFFEMNLEREM